MEAWVGFTLLAAFMQAIRTSGQKKLAQTVSPMGTTLVRYLFGLPFAALYLWLLAPANPAVLVTSLATNTGFLVYASLAAVAQILATVCLVKILSHRNFAVGTSFAKTEAIQTAVLGMVFFASILSGWAWLAVLLGVLGIVVMSLPERGRFDRRGAYYGVLAGSGFALTSLWLRQASLGLGLSLVESAAITLVYMVVLQTLICLVYVAAREPEQFSLIRRHLPLAIFIGATSAFGSVGWYTAMTFENPALVKSLGQIELVFTLAITHWVFRERITGREYLGIAAIVLSVLILLLY